VPFCALQETVNVYFAIAEVRSLVNSMNFAGLGLGATEI
jgi:hypothetical protein